MISHVTVLIRKLSMPNFLSSRESIFSIYPKNDRAYTARKLHVGKTVTLEEAIKSEIIQSEALVNLIERKGIIAKQELLEEIKSVKAQMAKLKG